MGNDPFQEIESNFLDNNISINPEEINNNESQIIYFSDFRDFNSINKNYLDIIQPNISSSSSSSSSDIVNANLNNKSDINQSEKEKEIIILIHNNSNINDIPISNNINNNNYNNNKTISNNNSYINRKRLRHTRLAKDNIKRKINVYYSRFVCSLLNDIIKQLLNENIQFFQLSHSFTKNVTRTAFNSLKNKSLGDVFKDNVSPKYNKKKNWKKLNTKIYNKISRNKILKNILDKPYFEFFKDFLHHNKILNLSKYGLNQDILLLNNNNYFNALKKNNKTDDLIADQKYFIKMDEIINKEFNFNKVFSITKFL